MCSHRIVLTHSGLQRRVSTDAQFEEGINGRSTACGCQWFVPRIARRGNLSCHVEPLSYSVGVQLMIVDGRFLGKRAVAVVCSTDLSSFSPPSRIGISLTCDCPGDEISSTFAPLLDFLAKDTFANVVLILVKSRETVILINRAFLR